jgi:hypothetical protein
MSWRDLPEVPEDTELARPHRVVEADEGLGGRITVYFTDHLSRQWFAEWLRSRRSYHDFGTWVDERR